MRPGRCFVNPSSKTEWRSWAKSVRASLPDASDAVCAHLERFIRDWNAVQPEDWSRLQTIVAYRAFGDEVHLETLVDALPELEWLTTRTESDGHLSLHPFQTATHRHQLGMLEPPLEALPIQRLGDWVDAILVPGLVFDHAGNRVGYGKGFYDRLLLTMPMNIPYIGVTRDALIVDTLPHERLDIEMSHLATESGIRPVVASPMK
jgi:5-formyltetrahydrofolate cyclo-ligase